MAAVTELGKPSKSSFNEFDDLWDNFYDFSISLIKITYCYEKYCSLSTLLAILLLESVHFGIIGNIFCGERNNARAFNLKTKSFKRKCFTQKLQKIDLNLWVA